MIILGVDPGSVRTGWGVIERRGPRLVGLAAGVIQAGERRELPDRLHTIHAELSAIITAHRPLAMAVEDMFYAKHARAAIVLGQARGVCLLAGSQAGLPIASYPPSLVKRSVSGRGQAQKDQVARIVAAMLQLAELPAVDATDALAIAITHANASRVVQGAVSSVRRSPRAGTAR